MNVFNFPFRLRKHPDLFLLFIGLVTAFYGEQASAQTGREIKWLRVGSLHHYIMNWGAEIEMGRTGRVSEQMDGLRWPAQFQNQDGLVAKGLWIGCTGYQDRNGQTYPYKVISIGPRVHDEFYQFIPVEFKMIGRFDHPLVYVDGAIATDNDLNDIVDELDENLVGDRMVINRLVTYLGIEVTRKVMQFSQQYHDNYLVCDYVFKNTGVYDLDGNTDPKTLNDVYFYFQYRYGGGLEAFRAGSFWYPANSINWGANAVNQVVGIGPKAGAFDLRAQYSWFGLHNGNPVTGGWGCPNPRTGKLSAVQYSGSVILHVDTDPHNQTDNPSQPSTTMYMGSDQRPENYNSDMFNQVNMNAQYLRMNAGHPAATHADQVGDGYANTWGSDPGGYAQGQGFGPYTLAPGDSIHIILAEGVGGIDWEKRTEVGQNWYKWYSNTGQPELSLPGGTITTDFNLYKESWVKTGEDSILKTFHQADALYQNQYLIPQPPPPPEFFQVQSGGDRIVLTWSNNSDTWPTFDGYEIYRAVGKPDTLYEKIFSCDKSNSVTRFDDKTALRGLDYYYYIVSKDNASQTSIPLVSSKFYTMTNAPAFLRKPAITSTLDSIRVVPNPFNIRASYLQFGSNNPDRIGFYGLPPECSIKIYTERGDLIQTIVHDDGTADELWDSFTSSRQIIVSGVYIAYFEVTKDSYDPHSGQLSLRKGDHIIRKFFVIR